MSKRDLGKIYVTGADGFIGSHLTEKLLEMGFEVTALCLYNSFNSYGWLEEIINKKPKNLTPILGDIRDPYFMEHSMKDHDTVFHLAALIAIPYSYVAPESYIQTNVLGTLNVLQASRKTNVTRFIHTSTSEVYGTAQFVPITEKHPLQGQSPYSASKISADMLVESFYRSMSFPATILRPFNTFGPRQSMRAVIPTIISQVLSGQKEIKIGNLTPTRDFNFVFDTVDAFIKVAEANEDVLGQTLNTGTGVEISIKDLILKIGNILGVSLAEVLEQERFRPQNSEVERLLSDSSRLRQMTGWKPKFTLDEGIKIVSKWMKTQEIFLKNSSKYVI